MGAGIFRLAMIFIVSVMFAAAGAPALAGEKANADPPGDGADASNPTASVNFQDLRYRYFDLKDGREKHSFETEGSYSFSPRFKVTNELRGAIPTKAATGRRVSRNSN